MKLGVAAIVGAALAAVATAWAWQSSKEPTHAPPPQAAAIASAALPPTAARGREFLTRAQRTQALASGTRDRPVTSLLDVRTPLQFGDYSWNDAGIPAGTVWVRVDLGSQLISVFRGGDEIGTAVIVYGGDNKETPAGKLHILAKDRDHRSSLYDAEMPYTLQLTGDGVSIHGSKVRWGAATHGCIGVPLEFARRLFEQAKIGDEVVIVPPRTQTS
jgi:lipoprotein-anchoring transpeptidase ErfK/SrfK